MAIKPAKDYTGKLYSTITLFTITSEEKCITNQFGKTTGI